MIVVSGDACLANLCACDSRALVHDQRGPQDVRGSAKIIGREAPSNVWQLLQLVRRHRPMSLMPWKRYPHTPDTISAQEGRGRRMP